jgi:hypothetical protein
MLPLTGAIPSYWKHQRARELWQTTSKFLNDSRFWQWITWTQVSGVAILAQAEVRIAFTFRCSDRTQMSGCREICHSERNTSNPELTQTVCSRHYHSLEECSRKMDCTLEMRQWGWAHSAGKGLQSEAKAILTTYIRNIEKGKNEKKSWYLYIFLGDEDSRD